ncbi:MAG: hypothetical protein R2752_16580 [Vicinamibacterales bacterium]
MTARRRMGTWMVTAALAAGLATTVDAAAPRDVAQAQAARQEPAPAPAPSPIDGRWAVSVDTPHGALAMTLQLALDPKDQRTVTGRLHSDDMGDFPFKGEFVDGRLTFAVRSDENEMRCTATVKDADHLTVVISGHGADLPGEATRIKAG